MKTMLDPIIAVKDVNSSLAWYEEILGFKKIHGGSHFSVLTNENDEVILCLHKWGEHQHPSLSNQDKDPGNGLLLYFRTGQTDKIYNNIMTLYYPIEKDMHINSNAMQKELSILEPDGYYITITSFHNYDGQ